MAKAQNTEIVFEWMPRIEGEIAFVEEYVDGVHQKSYGPMPALLAEQFIFECKQRITQIFMKLYGDDNGQDATQKDQP